MPETFLTDSAVWTDSVYKIETDLANRQAQDLADRTTWLKQEVEGVSADLTAHEASNNHPLATTAAKGMVQLASDAEAIAGTDTTKAVTPASLNAAVPPLVQSAIDTVIGGAPADLNSLGELAAALGNDANFAANVNAALATKAALDSPALTGTPTAPTPGSGSNNTNIATTAFVQNAVSGIVVPSASSAIPAVDGVGSAGSAAGYSRGDHVHPTDSSRAPLNSPGFTGSPTAPTPATGTNNTQVATTAFVQNAVGGLAVTRYFESADQAITTNGSLVINHDLGVAPKMLQLVIRCVSADSVFSVGDVVYVGNGTTPFDGGTANQRGCTVRANASQILIRYSANTNVFLGITGGSSLLTNSKWVLVVRAFA